MYRNSSHWSAVLYLLTDSSGTNNRQAVLSISLSASYPHEGGLTARETSFVSPEQQAKAYSPIDVTEFGMVKEVNPEQYSKASSPIEVTELGMVVFLQPTINLFVDVLIIALQLSRESYVSLFLSTTNEVSPEHPEKAQQPMEMTELGMVMEVNPEQHSKACSPMEMTELGIVMDSSIEHSAKASWPIYLTELPMVAEVSPKQSEKASSPMEMTELGMITDVRPEHPWKARSLIEVTELPMVTDFSPVHSLNAYSPIVVTELGMVTSQSRAVVEGALAYGFDGAGDGSILTTKD